MRSNIPASLAYGVYISQLIRYARASSNDSAFLKRHLHLRSRLLDQGYKKNSPFAMHFHIVKMYKDKEVKKNVKDIFLSMCDIKIFLTFTSPNMVLL